MATNGRIAFRVTRQQQERIETDSKIRGFKSVSQYLRSLTLDMDGATVRKIDDIYRRVVPKEQKEKAKERPLTAYF